MSKYILVGKAASGKDTAQEIFIKKGYKPLVQYTTRPKRPNESGNEYHFISVEQFEKMNNKGKFISTKCFNGWYYALSYDDLKKCDVGILSVGNINDIMFSYPELLKFATIIYLDIPTKIRRERLKNRYKGGNEDDSVERRLSADKKDFENFKTFDLKFTTNSEADEFINSIEKIR